jgi:hypothetical protein
MPRGRWNHPAKLRVLAEIVRYTEAHRVPPTIEEVAHALGVSLPVVHGYCQRLEIEGAIESLWVAGRRSPRSMRATPSRQLVLVS